MKMITLPSPQMQYDVEFNQLPEFQCFACEDGYIWVYDAECGENKEICDVCLGCNLNHDGMVGEGILREDKRQPVNLAYEVSQWFKRKLAHRCQVKQETFRVSLESIISGLDSGGQA